MNEFLAASVTGTYCVGQRRGVRDRYFTVRHERLFPRNVLSHVSESFP
jgi:hypothetical protein